MNLIEISNLTKKYKNLHAVDNASINIPEGKIIGLLGKNGAGKSTLLKILSGEQEYDTGQIASDKEISIGFLKQDIDFVKGRTVLEEA
ncbi:MAG: ABC-F family ATP-binding cassette domain-containing protein, partial [Candidatus Cloacimonetes bacterium]|nr:ABC-F family ATP-binding cassette domain-containing protein [Candidatus Cloacimonadota bacterium]